MNNWPVALQHSFFITCVIATALTIIISFIAFCCTLDSIFGKKKERTIEAAECDHVDNKTGLCVLQGRNCVTQAECNREMEMHK